MKPKLIKDFDKLLKLARKVLRHYFDEGKIDQIIEEGKCEYGGLIPQLPYIGAKKTKFERVQHRAL